MLFRSPHAADDHCTCRKPKTGMIEDISRRFSVDLSEVYACGDSLRDLQAFSDVGCKPILVLSGKGEETLAAGNLPPNTLIFADLNEAVQHTLLQKPNNA